MSATRNALNSGLAHLEKELMNRREELVKGIRVATQNFINNDNEDFFKPDVVDQASADADREIEVRMKNRDREQLAQIDVALRRIDAGTFGLCGNCGDSITVARMQVNPATSLCIDCKAELESERGRHLLSETIRH